MIAQTDSQNFFQNNKTAVFNIKFPTAVLYTWGCKFTETEY